MCLFLLKLETKLFQIGFNDKANILLPQDFWKVEHYVVKTFYFRGHTRNYGK